MAFLPQLGSVPAAYAVVAGGCDWPLPSAVGLGAYPIMMSLRYVPYVPYIGALRWMKTPFYS